MKRAVVVGGGHAGIEAALALAKMNIETTLITGDLNKVASLPCNPSIGGPAKGIVVREIDALGGQMGKSADFAAIQMKMLNSSKGPAVRALRAQIDKVEYPKFMLGVLKKTKKLRLIEGYVQELIIDGKIIRGVMLESNEEVKADAVILATGTYLNSRILIGDSVEISGPNGEKTTRGISDQLRVLGFEVIRLKTGTPPRIARKSVNFAETAIQNGDLDVCCFSHTNKVYNGKNVPCYLTYTNAKTHTIIKENIHRSAMYSGNITGIGPRYCPSIEDKIVRFKDKERHQIFLEPESMSIDELYIQGLSTSLPKDVQEKIVCTVKGLESAKINKYAYAIEYDAINPLQLLPTLESKLVENLFFAGQINGTSGYEEAAGQGIMAGINAALKLKNENPFILRRDEAYIGVLIDDLVTKGTKEPYRLLTSRAEFRLLLRNDNADLRLREYGYKYGLVDKKEFIEFEEKKEKIANLLEIVQKTKILPNEKNNEHLVQIGSSPLNDPTTLLDLIKRPEFSSKDIQYFAADSYTGDILEQVELQIKYDGYIKKAYKEAERLNRLENKKIPENIEYDNVHNLSSEAKEKLKKVRPLTIGQASRILGVNPVDIMMLTVFIESSGGNK